MPFNQTTRRAAFSLIGIASVFLALGLLLFQAASATGAVSDYRIQVSWFSALSSGVWPLTWRSVGLLSGALLLAVLLWLTFFRTPRAIGGALLFLEAAIAGFLGGVLGLFFLIREFQSYHFRIDGERLGEYWFTFEGLAVWMLAVATLAVIRIFARDETRKERI